jgi:hypothetical protein
MNHCSGQRKKQSMPKLLHFPLPWLIEDIDGYFVVKANNGQPLVFISYRDGSRAGPSRGY